VSADDCYSVTHKCRYGGTVVLDIAECGHGYSWWSRVDGIHGPAITVWDKRSHDWGHTDVYCQRCCERLFTSKWTRTLEASKRWIAGQQSA
jgi:hypothetical protein